MDFCIVLPSLNGSTYRQTYVSPLARCRFAEFHFA
jgi:hypothetical protein